MAHECLLFELDQFNTGTYIIDVKCTFNLPLIHVSLFNLLIQIQQIFCQVVE
jgi:hypothetical protein